MTSENVNENTKHAAKPAICQSCERKLEEIAKRIPEEPVVFIYCTDFQTLASANVDDHRRMTGWTLQGPMTLEHARRVLDIGFGNGTQPIEEKLQSH